jgi:cation diffusion facilitator CzcD-associated flavoprotein CzcO
MFTFGYRFKPWNNPQALSAGENILNYLEEAVDENQLGQHIMFRHKMVGANWSGDKGKWIVQVDSPEGEKEITCNFLNICTGYYNYKEAHRPRFKGEEDFNGPIVLPQFWPKNLDYTGKKIVVVGSGATAVTLVPAMVEGGASAVTMVQRSPTYIMNLPNRNNIYVLSKKLLPDSWAYRITRGVNITMQMVSYGLSRLFPKWMKRQIMDGAAKQLPKEYPVETHFNPSYNPWDQRLCVVPDGDLFSVIKEGKANIETGSISHFNDKGVVLTTGKQLEADILILATGLKMQLLGGANLHLNNQPINITESMVYKGMMLSDVPNLIYTFGYTNASWTLKADLTANYLCKLLNYMSRKNYSVVMPQKNTSVGEENFLNLSSGYIERAQSILPKQGKKRPWRVYQNYLVDMLTTRFGNIKNRALKFI